MRLHTIRIWTECSQQPATLRSFKMKSYDGPLIQQRVNHQMSARPATVDVLCQNFTRRARLQTEPQ
jgi:hypothetical protein